MSGPVTLQECALAMLDELESTSLEVVLVPQRVYTNEGGMIRVAAAKNCAWYRRFCAAYLSSRVRRKTLVDMAIKRRHTVRALREIAAGRCRSRYAVRLLPWVRQWRHDLPAVRSDRASEVRRPVEMEPAPTLTALEPCPF